MKAYFKRLLRNYLDCLLSNVTLRPCIPSLLVSLSCLADRGTSMPIPERCALGVRLYSYSFLRRLTVAHLVIIKRHSEAPWLLFYHSYN